MTQLRDAEQLVGREPECAAIEAFLDQARGQSLLIEGEAGIGKTTLWSAGVEGARERGLRVLLARPAEAERALSFAALSDLLADVQDEIVKLPTPQRRPLTAALLLDETDGSPIEPRAIAVGLLTLLRNLARERPLLVAVDDVQWVDASSSIALSFALRRTSHDAVATLLARRTEAEIGGGLDPAALDVERVEVGPLSLGAFRQLLDLRTGASMPRPILRRIHERSAGNPFFGLELARALAERGGQVRPHDDLPVPNDLQRLLAARLDVLPPALKEPLAAVAALAEPTFDHVDEAILAPAFDAGVLVLEGDRIRFDHPLLATAAYSRLTPRQRRALHRRLADVVGDVEQRARHLAAAAEGPDPGLAAVLDDAAARARSRGAPEAAADLSGLAFRVTDPSDHHTRVLRSIAASEHRMAAGDHQEARRLIEDALAEEPADADRARLLLQRSRLGDQSDDGLIALLHEARTFAAEDAALEAEILADLAQWITNARRIADAEPYARRSLELAERVGDPVALVRALETLAFARFAGGHGLSAELVERAVALDPFCESMRINRRPIAIFAHECMWAGDLDRARALLDRARKLAHDRADVTAYAVLGYTAQLELLADEWQASLEHTQELYELGVEAEHHAALITGLTGRGLLFAHLGDEEQSRRDVARALALDERMDGRFAPRIGRWGLGLLELSLDNPTAALEQAREATAEPRAEGVEEPALLPAFPIYVEAAIATGELREATEVLDWVEERALRVDRAWALACCARCRGLLAAAQGDEAGAVAEFERALAEHAHVQGRRFDLARTLLAQGETLRRLKKKRPAREAIEAALAIFDELGAKLWSEKARRELARVSGRTASEGLTETERRVAALVAAGRSNKEVASELFVTVRTVETHLTKIYAKLGVRSRTELVSRLSR